MSAILGKISSDAMVSVFEEAVSEAYRHGLNAGLANKLTEGTFEWAMLQMRQGKTVTRRGSKHVLCIVAGVLRVDEGRGNFCSVATHDMMSTDWEIMPKPEAEGHDFLWALEQMRNDYRVRRKAWGVAGIDVSCSIAHLTADSIQAKDWVFA